MSKKWVVLFAVILVFSIFLFIGKNYLYIFNAGNNLRPTNGFVPDEKTAAKIAEVILKSIYGEELIEREKPFEVQYSRINNIWIVSGRLPDGYVGGVASISIRKSDGKILGVSHGK